MSAFLETPRFPEDISYGSQGGPSYNTTIATQAAGHEKRNINWSLARYNYNVAYGIKDQADLESLLTFFHSVAGRAYGFRFKDHHDYKSGLLSASITDTDQVCRNTVDDSLTGDGSTTTFQLVKTYTQGANSRQRDIKKPVSGTVVVAIDGTPQTASPLGWSVDTATGVITFSTAPTNGQVVTAGFEFDVPCRFESDQIAARWDDYQLMSADVGLIEIR